MVDTLSPAERSRRMARIRNKDTSTELVVRRMIYGLGFRYRLHRKDLPGCPDLAFQRLKSVIFVHGCFWHRHSDPNCRLARLPKSRLDFWERKLSANRARDLRNQELLAAGGWRVLIIWECELSKRDQLERKLKEFLGRTCFQSNCLPGQADSGLA